MAIFSLKKRKKKLQNLCGSDPLSSLTSYPAYSTYTLEARALTPELSRDMITQILLLYITRLRTESNSLLHSIPFF